MSRYKKVVFTAIATLMAGVILSVDEINGFYILAPHSRYYVDVLVSILLVGMGLLLDINLQKLHREKEIKRELLRVNRELADLNSALQRSLKDIRVLKGLLPICSACKKIRNDKGYWQKLEQYIQEHTEAEFSHGICPDCAKKMYGLEAPPNPPGAAN